jgi:hypothetical protein
MLWSTLRNGPRVRLASAAPYFRASVLTGIEYVLWHPRTAIISHVRADAARRGQKEDNDVRHAPLRTEINRRKFSEGNDILCKPSHNW